jgi:hypothetical protein
MECNGNEKAFISMKIFEEKNHAIINYFEMKKGGFALNYKSLPEELLDACIEHVHYNNEQLVIKPNIFVKKNQLCCKGGKHLQF